MQRGNRCALAWVAGQSRVGTSSGCTGGHARLGVLLLVSMGHRARSRSTSFSLRVVARGLSSRFRGRFIVFISGIHRLSEALQAIFAAHAADKATRIMRVTAVWLTAWHGASDVDG